ncbi:hypothetical protein KI387_029946, partial [Taxus chinensis]
MATQTMRLVGHPFHKWVNLQMETNNKAYEEQRMRHLHNRLTQINIKIYYAKTEKLLTTACNNLTTTFRRMAKEIGIRLEFLLIHRKSGLFARKEGILIMKVEDGSIRIVLQNALSCNYDLSIPKCAVFNREDMQVNYNFHFFDAINSTYYEDLFSLKYSKTKFFHAAKEIKIILYATKKEEKKQGHTLERLRWTEPSSSYVRNDKPFLPHYGTMDKALANGLYAIKLRLWILHVMSLNSYLKKYYQHLSIKLVSSNEKYPTQGSKKPSPTFELPKQEYYVRVEAPKGELGVFLIGDDNIFSWRWKIRSPGLINLKIWWWNLRPNLPE